jgi:hypothetical protein
MIFSAKSRAVEPTVGTKDKEPAAGGEAAADLEIYSILNVHF